MMSEPAKIIVAGAGLANDLALINELQCVVENWFCNEPHMTITFEQRLNNLVLISRDVEVGLE